MSLLEQLKDLRKGNAAVASGGRLSPYSSRHVFDAQGPDRTALRSPTRNVEFGVGDDEVKSELLTPTQTLPQFTQGVQPITSMKPSTQTPSSSGVSQVVGSATLATKTSTPAANVITPVNPASSMQFFDASKALANPMLPSSVRQRLQAEIDQSRLNTSGGRLTEALFRVYFLPTKAGDEYFSRALPSDREELCSFIKPYVTSNADTWETILSWIVRLYLPSEWIVWMMKNRPTSHTGHIHGLLLRQVAKSPLYKYAVDKQRATSIGLQWAPQARTYGFTLADLPPPELVPDFLEHVLSTYLRVIGEFEHTRWPTRSWFSLAELRPCDALAEQVVQTYHAHTFGEQADRAVVLRSHDKTGATLMTACAREMNIPLTKFLLDNGCNIFQAGMEPSLSPVLIWADHYRQLHEKARKEEAASMVPKTFSELHDTSTECLVVLNTLCNMLETAIGVLTAFKESEEQASVDPNGDDPIQQFFVSLQAVLGDEAYNAVIDVLLGDDPEEAVAQGDAAVMNAYVGLFAFVGGDTDTADDGTVTTDTVTENRPVDEEGDLDDEGEFSGMYDGSSDGSLDRELRGNDDGESDKVTLEPTVVASAPEVEKVTEVPKVEEPKAAAPVDIFDFFK